MWGGSTGRFSTMAVTKVDSTGLCVVNASLATDLGLARNTVADAYAELVAEGWLASKQGAGTWVVNLTGRGMPTTPRGVRVVPTHNLMPGSPDVSEFPRAAWVAMSRTALGTPSGPTMS